MIAGAPERRKLFFVAVIGIVELIIVDRSGVVNELAAILRHGRKHCGDGAAHKLRLVVERTDVRDGLDELLDGFESEFRMLKFAEAEHQRDLHLVSVEKEHFGETYLDEEVMVVNAGTQFDFLHLGRGLLLLLLLFRFFVKILSVIDDTADGRLRGRCDFEQIQAVELRDFERFLGSNNPELFAARPDAADFGGTDAFIATRSVIVSAAVAIIASVAIHAGARSIIVVAAKLLGCGHSGVFVKKALRKS